MMLVNMLVKFGDVPAAAKWSVRCGLSVELLPCPVQHCLMEDKVALVNQLTRDGCVSVCESEWV